MYASTPDQPVTPPPINWSHSNWSSFTIKHCLRYIQWWQDNSAQKPSKPFFQPRDRHFVTSQEFLCFNFKVQKNFKKHFLYLPKDRSLVNSHHVLAHQLTNGPKKIRSKSSSSNRAVTPLLIDNLEKPPPPSRTTPLSGSLIIGEKSNRTGNFNQF